MSHLRATYAPRRLTPPSARPLSDAAEPDDVSRLAQAFAAAADLSAGPGSPSAAWYAVVATLDEAVRVYVTACKADGLPSEQALIRVTDVTRRSVITFRDPRDAVVLRAVVFSALLHTYYGDDRGQCAPAPASAPHDALQCAFPAAAPAPARRRR